MTMKKAVQAYFEIEKRRNPSLLARTQLSVEREYHYKEVFEDCEHQVLETIGFDFDAELPYKYIHDFCHKHLPLTSRDAIYELTVKFCNDSFKIAICLYYHPKVIAAACIHMAALWRKNKGLDLGLSLEISGHSWFKWIDQAIDQK